MKHSIFIILFFIGVGVFSGAMNIQSVLMVSAISSIVLFFKWREIQQKQDDKNQYILERIVFKESR